MYNKDTQIVETVSGQWLRFPNHFKKSTCLVELSNQISLNIDMKSGNVHVHKKDQNQVYQHIGDVFISASSSNQIQCNIMQSHSLERSDSLFSGFQQGGGEAAKALEKEESA
ncbi:hypothetical protein N0M98_07150 [Paenibacillus doosanensis]|uniref:hypothetical protein n=1 Tax=Paenibacillus doosanensis TaxID=1229154 RepID=UPI00217FC340|nr:hypothetical protein [Paenibacillus doosanensis]MCS7459916.1 hypothetical protein [Paenibacillus doosanensis]